MEFDFPASLLQCMLPAVDLDAVQTHATLPPARDHGTARRTKRKIHKCQYDGCFSAFSQMSNLRKHEVNIHGRPKKFTRGPSAEEVMASSPLLADQSDNSAHSFGSIAEPLRIVYEADPEEGNLVGDSSRTYLNI